MFALYRKKIIRKLHYGRAHIVYSISPFMLMVTLDPKFWLWNSWKNQKTVVHWLLLYWVFMIFDEIADALILP